MTGADLPSRLLVEQYIRGFRMTQVIYAAVKLGIADLLQDGPRTGAQLALATGANTSALRRLLRTLVAAGILTQVMDDSFALTPAGDYLRADVAGSVRNRVLFFGDKATWSAWGSIIHSVQTGEPAYQREFWLDVWEYRRKHPETAELFNNCMAELASIIAPALTKSYDFSDSGSLVDVGGGYGQMLACILQANPALHGVLFDLPNAVERALGILEAAGVADRCEIIGGDMFAGIPSGFENYLLSRVIHNWDDRRAITILNHCHQAMKSNGKLLLVERVIMTGAPPDLQTMITDMIMLVETSGKTRTDIEFRALLKAASFELTQFVPVLDGLHVIQAIPS